MGWVIMLRYENHRRGSKIHRALHLTSGIT